MKKIVIAEDNELNITILMSTLSQQYELFIARSAEEVYSIIEQNQPDLFLLDIVMSGISGIDLCHELRRRDTFKETPILFMSAVHDKKVYDSAFNAGANSFIEKPFKSLDLKQTISNLLNNA